MGTGRPGLVSVGLVSVGLVCAGRARVVAARPDRGTYADLTRAAAAGLAGFMAVQVPGLRATEAVGVPAVRVITQVVIDMSPVAAVCGAVITGLPRIAIPNVKVISFAAHASSLVARRSRLTGMRPLPERDRKST